MCLIIAKPKGIRLPKNKKLKQWFNDYPDGFGIAFQYEGKVRILKGAMNHKDMFSVLDNMRHLLGNVLVKETEMIIQFRAAVTGGVVPRFCHPFPITKDQGELDSLDVVTDCALAHNGVIYEYATKLRAPNQQGTNQKVPIQKDINDAQEFIKDYLVDMGAAVHCPPVKKLIEEYTISKFALLSNEGIEFIGDFISDKGLWFSNEGYKGFRAYGGDYGGDYDAEVVAYRRYSQHKNRAGNPKYTEEECDYCLLPSPILYVLPSKEASCVCHSCFEYFTGRSPLGIEVACQL